MTCYICDPTNPDADEEGCRECEREAFGFPRVAAKVIERRYERRAARRYAHYTPWRSCNGVVPGFCLRCLWRTITGKNRRDKAAAIERLRNFEYRRPISAQFTTAPKSDRVARHRTRNPRSER